MNGLHFSQDRGEMGVHFYNCNSNKKKNTNREKCECELKMIFWCYRSRKTDGREERRKLDPGVRLNLPGL